MTIESHKTRKEYKSQWYAENRKRILANRKLQRATNPEKYANQKKKDYLKHRDARLKKSGEWAKANPDRRAASLKRYAATSSGKIKASKSAYRERNRESLRQKNRLYHNTHKEQEVSYRQLNRERRVAFMRAWKSTRRTELAQKQRTYYAKMRNQCLASHRAYRQANPARVKEIQRRCYLANREHYNAKSKAWRVANRERYQRAERLYRFLNRDKIRAKAIVRWNRRRALKQIAAIGTDRKAYLAFVTFVRVTSRIKCYWCGKSAPKGERTIDHIVPLAKRGADDVFNLCCACSFCNTSKGAKMPEAYSGQFEIAFTAVAPLSSCDPALK